MYDGREDKLKRGVLSRLLRGFLAEPEPRTDDEDGFFWRRAETTPLATAVQCPARPVRLKASDLRR